MNDINLNNYHDWQMRYITGGLTNDEEALFELFLLDNPQLMDDELENGQKLVAPVVTFANKDSLKKDASVIEGLSHFDFLAIKQTETGLDDAEKQQLESYIANNPGLLQDIDVYGKTKLLADTSVVFPYQSSLKRRTLGGAFLMRALKYTSAAAVVAAMVYFGLPTIQPNLSKQTAMVQVEQQGDETKPEVKPAPHPEKQKTDSIATPKTRKAKSSATPVMEMPSLEPNERLLASMQPKDAIDAIYQQHVNAYEEGLNVMMPQYLDNQIEINKLMALSMPDLANDSQRANFPVNVVEGGVKFFNFLGIKRMSVDKFYDQDGNLVAYKVKGETMEWSRKVKQP